MARIFQIKPKRLKSVHFIEKCNGQNKIETIISSRILLFNRTKLLHRIKFFSFTIIYPEKQCNSSFPTVKPKGDRWTPEYNTFLQNIVRRKWQMTTETIFFILLQRKLTLSESPQFQSSDPKESFPISKYISRVSHLLHKK